MLENIFNKPKWQHRDPAVRREAVADLSEEELELALPELTKDPAPEVRLASLQRTSNPRALHDAQSQDPDEEVREKAGELLRQLLQGPADNGLTLEQRLDFLRKVEDQALVEHLLSAAPQAELREALLDLDPRPKVLADVAVDDTEPKLRQLAVERISEEPLLERVARDTRKHDKRTHQQAEEKLFRLRLRRGDPDAVGRRREILCQQAEKLAWTVDREGDAKTLEEIVEEWKSLPVAPGPELDRRFERVCQIGRNAPEEPQSGESEAAAGEKEPALEERKKPAVSKVGRVVERAERLARDEKSGLGERLLARLRDSWRKACGDEAPEEEQKERFEKAMGRLEDLREQQRREHEKTLEEVREGLALVEKHLSEGDLRPARIKFRECSRKFKSLAGLTRKQKQQTRKRMSAVRAGVRELKEWQHWGNNQQRLRLIERMEALAESDLHPEDINKAIKAARREWMKLEESEKLPDDPPHYASGPGLWRRFHAAANRAFQPCKEYFKKRAEERAVKTKELEKVCERLESPPELQGDPPNWNPLDRLIREGARSLRRLNEIEPKKRGAMARRIRGALKKLDRRLKAVQKANEEAKKKLIEAAKKLHDEEDLSSATDRVRQIQQDWKGTGTTVRSREQALWKEFRAACNAVFERFSAERDAQRKAIQEQNKELAGICQRIEALARLKGEELIEAEERFQEQREAWKKAEASSPKLERRYVRACNRYADKLREVRKRELAKARFKALKDKSAICAELESADGLGAKEAKAKVEEARKRWEELPELGEEAEEAMKSRLQAACDALEKGRSKDQDKKAEKNLEQADLLCVRMEMLAGIDSPPESREARMKIQVSRLSSALADREAPPDPEKEAEEIQRELFLLGPLPSESYEAISSRFDKAMESFTGSG